MSPRELWTRLGRWRLPVVVMLAGALIIVTVPRLRAFYFGRGTERARSNLAAPAPSSGSGASTADSKKKVEGGRPILPDAEGRIRVHVSERPPLRLPFEGIPPGWTAKEFAGHASVELVRDDAHLALRLRSEQSSFALYRDVVVDLNAFPFLSWSWKIIRLPAEGDVREQTTDDQAAQVYVIFPRWPAPLKNSDVIGYVWDSRAPVGTRVTSTKAPNVKIIVVASGRSQVETWRTEERDVARDYAALFGRQAPRVGQVAVMIDTNDTRATAEALIGDLIFSKTRSESMESTTSMLR